MFDLYSSRIKQKLSGEMDVYDYENMPHETRVQIIHLWRRTIGRGDLNSKSYDYYKNMVNMLREEYGVFCLCSASERLTWVQEFESSFSRAYEVEKCLDAIELSARAVKSGLTDNKMTDFSEFCATINYRLREGRVGYQLEGTQIIKIDNQFVHSELVKPCLNVLSIKSFAGANDEFLMAHKHYREGSYKACLVECLKSFESTMKIICKERGWTPKGDTASKLIDTLLSNGLVPQYLQTQFTALRSVLESGVPTVRNKEGGHGQGATVSEVPEYLASYVLHQTAASVLFMVKAHQEK